MGLLTAECSRDVKESRETIVSAVDLSESVKTVSESLMDDSESFKTDSESLMGDSESFKADSESLADECGAGKRLFEFCCESTDNNVASSLFVFVLSRNSDEGEQAQIIIKTVSSQIMPFFCFTLQKYTKKSENCTLYNSLTQSFEHS